MENWLSDHEAARALDVARGAFPDLTWEYANQEDGEHDHFCLWGERAFDEESYHPRRFFVTFERDDGWRGHLTIGQHAYMWTSADFGDAYLASTSPRGSLEEAIGALKAEVTSLFAALAGRG